MSVMNSNPHPPDPARVAKLVAAVALTLLALSNLAWLAAYSSLSEHMIGVAGGLYGASPSPSPSAAPRGTISGNVGYPAGTAPAQTVCAVSAADASAKVCGDFAGGNALAYTLSVPAGTYYVYASLKIAQGDFATSYQAYYDKYVICGELSSCSAALHSQYIPVTVKAGQLVTGIDPTDWYAL
jgi:hypothetical protein